MLLECTSQKKSQRKHQRLSLHLNDNLQDSYYQNFFLKLHFNERDIEYVRKKSLPIRYQYLKDKYSTSTIRKTNHDLIQIILDRLIEKIDFINENRNIYEDIIPSLNGLLEIADELHGSILDLWSKYFYLDDQSQPILNNNFKELEVPIDYEKLFNSTYY